MRFSNLSCRLLLVVIGLAACKKTDDGSVSDAGIDGGGGAGGAPQDAGLIWFTTCGDPVCREDAHRPMPDVAPCTTQKAGDPCAVKNAVCDPGSDCNETLRCTDHDPKTQVGGCPISRRRSKDEIAYLTDHDRAEIAAELGRLKLARYRYKDDPSHRARLGFILEDAPQIPAADPSRDRVDLYSYLSMVVASLQSQEARMRAQADEIAALRAELARLRAADGRAAHGRDR